MKYNIHLSLEFPSWTWSTCSCRREQQLGGVFTHTFKKGKSDLTREVSNYCQVFLGDFLAPCP